MVTVLTETGTHDATRCDGDGLWMSNEDVERTLGWTLKPQGLCQGDVCVPLPAGKEAEFVREDEVNASGLWRHMGKAVTRSADEDVWFFGEGAQDRNDALLSLEAPDFTLPDFSGKLHSLTDFRRQRILLITWASW